MDIVSEVTSHTIYVDSNSNFANLKCTLNLEKLTILFVPLTTAAERTINMIEHDQYLKSAIKINELRKFFRPQLATLVSTISNINEGSHNFKCINVSPFCMVNEVSHLPPRIAIGVRHSNDTYKNIIDNNDFVVNVCDESFIPHIIYCSKKIPSNLSELDYIKRNYNMKLTPYIPQELKDITDVPGIFEAPLNVWCRFADKSLKLTYNDCNEYRTLFVADVLGIFVSDNDINSNNKFDPICKYSNNLLYNGRGDFGILKIIKQNFIKHNELLEDISFLKKQDVTADDIWSRIDITKNMYQSIYKILNTNN